MTWTIDAATAPASPFSGQSNPVQHTCAASAKLLVAFLFVNGTTARAGGAPTYNGATMTDSGQGFVFDTGGEAGVEVWYLLNPSTGSAYDLSVPNTGSVSMGINVVSYIPSSGGAAFDNSNKASGVSSTWSLSLTVSATGNLILGAVGSGERDVPSAGTNFTLHSTSDEGNQVWGSEYDLAGSATPVTVSFTPARSDDWGLIGISFEEAAATPMINESEGVAVGESAAAAVSAPQASTPSESVTVGEAVLMSGDLGGIAQTDGVELGEAVLMAGALGGVAVSADLTVGEDATVAIEAEAEPALSVAHDVTDYSTWRTGIRIYTP